MKLWTNRSPSCRDTTRAARLLDERGTSLIETLLALVVVAIGFLGILPLFQYAATTARVLEDKQAAYRVGFDAIEDLRILSFADIDDTYSDRIILSDGIPVRLSIDIDRGDDTDTWEDGDDVDINLIICTVAIQWRDSRGRMENMTLGLLRVRP